MNKTELVAAVAAKAEISKKEAAAAVEAVFEVIGDELQKKEKVQLTRSADSWRRVCMTRVAFRSALPSMEARRAP